MAAPRKAAATFAGLGGVRDELAGLRAEVERTKSEIATEEVRPVPMAEVERRIADSIAYLREQASRRVMIGGLLLPEGDSFAGHLADVSIPPLAGAALFAPGQLAAWLRERSAIASATMAEPTDDATRAKRLAELRAKLIGLERREAELLWSAEDAGVELPWRGDLDPAAALGLDAA